MKILPLILIFFFMSNTVNLNSNSDFTLEYEKGYKYVADNLDRYSKVKSKDELVNLLRKDFEIKEEVNIYSLSEITLNPKLLDASKEMNILLTKLNTGIESSNTYIEFLDVLATFEQGAKKDLSVDESKNALEYARLFKEIMEITMNDLQFYNKFTSDYNSDLIGWWSSWGKCAASIASGSLTGGLGGALGGSAVPVIGTVAGGIVGAIGGGLTGAAAGCD
jgi:hypothetical protein